MVPHPELCLDLERGNHMAHNESWGCSVLRFRHSGITERQAGLFRQELGDLSRQGASYHAS